MNSEKPDVKKITIEYDDGSKKVLDSGVCFSVYEEGDYHHVSCDVSVMSPFEELAIFAIAARMAKNMGITDELFNKAEEV